MDRLVWASCFAVALAEWYRGISVWTLRAIGEQCYSSTDEDPEGAARAYAERVRQPASEGAAAPGPRAMP